MQLEIYVKSKRNILEKLKNSKINSSFIQKESENILNAVNESKKEKESMKMSYEKFVTPFTI